MALAKVYDYLSFKGINNVNFEKLSTITSKCLLPYGVIVNSGAKSILIVCQGQWPLSVGI